MLAELQGCLPHHAWVVVVMFQHWHQARLLTKQQGPHEERARRCLQGLGQRRRLRGCRPGHLPAGILLQMVRAGWRQVAPR